MKTEQDIRDLQRRLRRLEQSHNKWTAIVTLISVTLAFWAISATYTHHKLWQQIEEREPNAYLTLLYWDSEMFKRRTRKRRELEGDVPVKDYKAECKKMLFVDADKYFSIQSMEKVHRAYRNFYVKNSSVMTNDHFRMMHDAILAGDPKLRSLRALYTTVYKGYADFSRETSPKGGEDT